MKVGDQYVIEVTEVINDKLCRIKGFNTLVFDQNGLDKLERFNVEVNRHYTRGYKDGFKDGKELNKKINETLCIGDEVVVNSITFTDPNLCIVISILDMDCRLLTKNGNIFWANKIDVRKTGKHYKEFNTFLDNE